jgi:hypothetical protein
MDVKSTWIPTWHLVDHVSWVTSTIFKQPLLGGRPNTKLEDHDTSNAHNRYDLIHDDPRHV